MAVFDGGKPRCENGSEKFVYFLNLSAGFYGGENEGRGCREVRWLTAAFGADKDSATRFGNNTHNLSSYSHLGPLFRVW